MCSIALAWVALQRTQGTIIRDLYFWLLDKNIFILLLIVSVMYITIGLFFAIIYEFILDSDDAIMDAEELRPDSFTDFEVVREREKKSWQGCESL